MPTSVELTQNLVRFRTINPPGDERACAERLASVLGGAGFAVDVVPFGGRNWSRASAAPQAGCRSVSPGISIRCRLGHSLGQSIRSLPKSLTANCMGAAHPT